MTVYRNKSRARLRSLEKLERKTWPQNILLDQRRAHAIETNEERMWSNWKAREKRMAVECVATKPQRLQLIFRVRWCSLGRFNAKWCYDGQPCHFSPPFWMWWIAFQFGVFNKHHRWWDYCQKSRFIDIRRSYCTE